jgi:thermitase
VKVISMSLGGYHFSQAYQEAINYAWNKGAVIVAAAGNDNISIPHYPSDYDNVISVGATDSNDQKADFSNFGQGVDVAAPGVDIYSTVVGGGYADFSGTSMSCPVVAGVAGLCFAYGGPATTNTAVRAAIEGTSDKVGPWLRLGRVNAFKALQKVSPPAIFTFGPTSADKHSGGTATGNVASVQHSDNSRFSISSAKTSLGPEAAIAISMKITQPLDKLVGLRFDMEAHAVAGATNTLFLYNWNTQGFEYFRSLPLSGSDQVRSFNIEPGSGYISPAGEVKMISRANVGGSHGRAGKPFTFRIDHVSLTGSFRTN